MATSNAGTGSGYLLMLPLALARLESESKSLLMELTSLEDKGALLLQRASSCEISDMTKYNLNANALSVMGFEWASAVTARQGSDLPSPLQDTTGFGN